ncbi:hypothetical protein [Streptomyces sp. UG1]|uniref:hypothetical protein n=1 Tax=Streptomyces sp. UG1 TaxID=3417652 RepID=UPI003CF0AAE4
MSTARRRSRSHTWLRVLVLLLALLVPGAHTQAHALPVAAGALEVAEHDVLDTALRPPARADRRSTVRRRPAGPPRRPAPAGTPTRPSHCAPPPPYVPHLLRTVVLRC